MMYANVEEVYKHGLCTGCGTCVNICPKSAIEIIKDEYKGVYIPQVNKERCNECGLCVIVCPGHSVDFKELNLDIFNKLPKNKLLGNHIACYVGHATDYTIRYNSTSGGLVTALLTFALEEGIIDGALVTRMNIHKPLEPEIFIARSKKDIVSASGSKKCPVPMNSKLNEILNEKGRFAVVGLPCHIHGIRKLEIVRKELRKKIVLHFGLFCGGSVTFLGTKYFLKTQGIKEEDVKRLSYRGMGWPGQMSILLENGEEIISKRLAERSFFRLVLYRSAFHYDFIPNRCLLCPDQTCELSDVSFGDPWLPEYLKKEKVGKSLIISRTEIGEKLLKNALSRGKIRLNGIDINDVLRAQNYSFKNGVNHRISKLKIFGKAVPHYTLNARVQPSFFSHPDMLLYLPSYISSKRWLWPLLPINAIARELLRFAFNV